MGAEGETATGAAMNPLDCFEECMRVCLQHLDRSVDRDMLEPLFVKLLLVEAYGAYEKTIRGAVDLRMANSDDIEFVRYLGRATERHDMPFGTVSTKHFMVVLEGMSDTADMHLAKEVKKTYSRLVKNRHSVAHGRKTEITLDELQCMHEMAKGVPLAFAAVLQRRFVQGG